MLAPERRKAPRTPSAERVTAIVDGFRRGCVITDISARGARLGFGAPAPLPRRFDLVFADGRRTQVRLIWQRELVAGVQFDTRPTLWERLVSALRPA